MKKHTIVAVFAMMSMVVAGCATLPMTPKQEVAHAEAKVRIVERLIARVVEHTGGGDGAIQLWITDNPGNARLTLDGIAIAIDLAILANASEAELKIPRATLKHFIILFENTTGEVFDPSGAPNGND